MRLILWANKEDILGLIWYYNVTIKEVFFWDHFEAITTKSSLRQLIFTVTSVSKGSISLGQSFYELFQTSWDFFVCLHTVTNDLIVGQVKRKLKRQKEMDVNNWSHIFFKKCSLILLYSHTVVISIILDKLIKVPVFKEDRRMRWVNTGNLR